MIMMKTIGAAVLIMVLPLFSAGQDKPGKKTDGLYLRLAPTTLLDLEGGLSAGLEYRLPNNISFVLEPALLLWNWMPEGNSSVEYNPYQLGYKLKPEVRYYFERRKKSPKRGQSFVAYEFMYKHTNRKLEREFGYYCNPLGNNCAFLKRDIYVEIKEVFSHSLKFGFQRRLGRNWLLEYYFGIGIRTKQINYRDIPPNAFFIPETDVSRILDLKDENIPYPSFPMGVKLVRGLR